MKKLKVIIEYLNSHVIVYEYSEGSELDFKIGNQLEICGESVAYKKYDVVGEIRDGELKMISDEDDEEDGDYTLVDAELDED